MNTQMIPHLTLHTLMARPAFPNGAQQRDAHHKRGNAAATPPLRIRRHAQARKYSSLWNPDQALYMQQIKTDAVRIKGMINKLHDWHERHSNALTADSQKDISQPFPFRGTTEPAGHSLLHYRRNEHPSRQASFRTSSEYITLRGQLAGVIDPVNLAPDDSQLSAALSDFVRVARRFLFQSRETATFENQHWIYPVSVLDALDLIWPRFLKYAGTSFDSEGILIDVARLCLGANIAFLMMPDHLEPAMSYQKALSRLDDAVHSISLRSNHHTYSLATRELLSARIALVDLLTHRHPHLKDRYRSDQISIHSRLGAHLASFWPRIPYLALQHFKSAMNLGFSPSPALLQNMYYLVREDYAAFAQRNPTLALEILEKYRQETLFASLEDTLEPSIIQAMLLAENPKTRGAAKTSLVTALTGYVDGFMNRHQIRGEEQDNLPPLVWKSPEDAPFSLLTSLPRALNLPSFYSPMSWLKVWTYEFFVDTGGKRQMLSELIRETWQDTTPQSRFKEELSHWPIESMDTLTGTLAELFTDMDPSTKSRLKVMLKEIWDGWSAESKQAFNKSLVELASNARWTLEFMVWVNDYIFFKRRRQFKP